MLQEDAAHLLRRAGFGSTAAQVAAFTRLDVNTAVNQLLNATPPAVDAPMGKLAADDNDWESGDGIINWWIQRMATTPAPLHEKMTLFWHGHFVSSRDKISVLAAWHQNQLYRTMGLGSFPALARAAIFSPAMLLYLDNNENDKKNRNENLAREQMELFTVGVGNYSQSDVVAGARAMTGHGITKDEQTYAFSPESHDNGMKTFFGITKNWNGPDIVNELVAGKGKALTAKRISTKLWEFFAYANPSPTLVNGLANNFIASQMNIKTLLHTIFTSKEFYSAASKQGHVRSPVEYMVATLKHSKTNAKDMGAEWSLSNMGQMLFFPPNVGGWKGDTNWITNASIWSKGNLARRAEWGNENLLKDTEKMTVAAAVQLAFSTFGVDKPAPTTRAAIEHAITNGRAAKKDFNERGTLITLVMFSPEYELG